MLKLLQYKGLAEGAIAPALSSGLISTVRAEARTHTKWLVAVLLSLLSYAGAYAQGANTYQFTAVPGTFTPINSLGTPTLMPAMLVDSYISPATSIGFTFTFEGVTYTQFKASSNGFISLNTTGTNNGTANALSTFAATSRPVLAPLWDDNDGRATGGSQAGYIVTGTAGSQVFTYEWLNWEWRYDATTPVISYQVKLYEATGRIEFIYRQDAGAPTAAATASIGIAGAAVGDFISLQNTSTSPTVSTSTENASLNTRPATGQIYRFTPVPLVPTDAGITALVAPAAVATGCRTATETVTVTIKNLGTSAISNIPVQVDIVGPASATLNGTYTGTLNPGETANFPLPGTINMTASGTYFFQAVTQLAGDGNTNNDMLAIQSRTVAPIVALPLSPVTFTGYDGSNLSTVFPNWTEGAGASGPVGTTSGWTNRTSAFPGNTTAAINLYSNGKNEWIVGPRIAAVSGTAIEFSAGLTDYFSSAADPAGMTGTDDMVRVMVSTNCGVTFTPVYTFNAANQPSNGSLTNYTVDLSAYAGQNIVVAIHATDGTVSNTPDYDFHIDNILIRNVPAQDVGITALLTPVSTVTGCRTATETVTVTIKNYGTAAISNVPVQVVVGGAVSTTLTDTYAGTINPGASANFPLPTTLDMTPGGTITFNASTQLGTDGYAANNAFAQQSRTDIIRRALPLNTLTFNNGATDFTGSNLSAVDPDWFESTITSVPVAATSNWTAPSATQITAFGRTAMINMASNTDRALIVGPKFVAASNTVVEFDAGIFDGSSAGADPAGMTGTDDAFQVMVSTNCGYSFTAVRTFNAAAPLSNGSLTLYQVSLAAYAGQNIIVALYANEGTVDDAPAYDLIVDNITIYNRQPTDAGIVDLLSPAPKACPNPSQSVTVTIRNYGSTALTSVPVRVVIGGPITQTLNATYTGNIAPGAEVNYTLPPTFNMSAVGSYTFNASTQIALDATPANDDLATVTRIVTAPVVLPVGPVTFTGFTGANLSAVFPDWSEGAGATAPGGTASLWANKTLGGGTTAGLNLYSTGKAEWIVGPKFSATATTAVEFKAAITEWSGTGTGPDPDGMGADDMVRVMVSTDCGNTFTPVYTFDGANQPSNGSLSIYQVNLFSYAGQDIIVAFFATDGTVDDAGDYDFHIDDILIKELPTADAGVSALVSPATTGCYGTESVTVTIMNYGVAAISNIPVTVNVTGAVTQTLTGTYTGSIAPGATANFTLPATLNMNASGTYSFNASTNLSGDANNTNDALAAQTRTVTPLASLPTATVTFTGFTGANLSAVFPGWSEGAGATVPGGTASGWTNKTLGGTTAGLNLYSTGKAEWIVGPKFTATATTAVLFNAAITEWSGTGTGPDPDGMGADDMVRVMVSTDCGNSFSPVYTFNGANQPSNGSLSAYQVNLSSYAGQEIIVAFFATDGAVADAGDYDFHIDNILIKTLPAADAGISALINPSADVCLGGAESVTVTISNYGAAAISNVPVRVTTTGAFAQTLNGTYAGTIPVGGSVNFTLPTTANFSTFGNYTIKAYTLLGTDGDNTNDSMNVVTRNTFVVTSLPYLQNFEGSTVGTPGVLNGGWTRNPATGFTWEVDVNGTSSIDTGPSVDHTLGTAAGKFVFTEASNGVEGSEAFLISPCIDLTSSTAPALEYWYHMYGATIDRMNVQVFNGTTWTTVETLVGEQQTAENAAWLSSTIDLTAYAGTVIKVRFRVVRGTDYTGDVAIDDVRIFNIPNEDASITALVSPAPLGCFGNAEAVTVRIRNRGLVDLTSIPVSVKVTGPVNQTLSGTFNGTLAPGASTDFTLPATLNMTAAGTYSFKAYSTLATDPDNSNDTLAVQTRTTLPTVAVPTAPVTFTSFTGTNLTTVHPNWSEGSGATLPAGGASAWTGSLAAQQTQLGDITATLNLYTTTRREWIVGPKFVPNANTRLNFEVAVTDWQNGDPAIMGSDDRVSVMVSTNCGATFTSIKDFTAADNLSNQLTFNSLSLGAYAGQSVVIAFFGTDGLTDNLEDYDFHLDNIQVTNTVIPPMTGTYTINKAVATGNGTTGTNARNFRSFTDAMNALNQRTVSGSIVLNVTAGSGPYTERVLISDVVYAAGAPATTSITINGNGNEVVGFVQRTVTKGFGVVTIDGTDRVTINGLTIKHSDTSVFGWGVHLINGADNITLANNVITVNETSTNKRNYMGIVATANYTQIQFPGNNVTNLQILNNTITGGYQGIRINGNSASPSPGIVITGNTITSAYQTGIYLTYLDAPVVGAAAPITSGLGTGPGNNTVTMRTNNELSTGIHIEDISGSAIVQRNKVTNAGTFGIDLLRVNYPAGSGSVVVANNMVGAGFQNPVNTYGIAIRKTHNATIAFNSVNLDFGDDAAALDVSKPYSSGLIIKNNSLAYTGTGDGYALRLGDGEVLAGIGALDYNNYFSTGKFVRFDHLDFDSLAALKADNMSVFAQINGVGKHDLNSREGNPDYVANSNLHAQGTQLANKGIAIAAITRDFDGTVRTGNPDIGADEFVFSGSSRMAAAAASGSLEMSAYPNPLGADGQLQVSLSAAQAGQVQLIVTDLLGRQLLSVSRQVAEGTSVQTLDLSAVSKGMYLLTVTEGNNVQTLKIVKE